MNFPSWAPGFHILLGPEMLSRRPLVAPPPPPPPKAAVLELSNCRLPEYPIEAKAQNGQGKVTIRVLVDKLGEPKSGKIIKSSGSDDLDFATISAILLFKFIPGSVEGVAAESQSLIIYNWEIIE